ncbi:MAG: hypothetical protein JO033_27035 [Acidobacteriaceae bacterium]|nr:hypothetical protein [Acidobacteriaceae bacterium]MBV9502652.1 hypothetical protein [Acidobacteriaceae bacterium]
MKKAARISIGALFIVDGIGAFLSPTEYPRRLQAGAPMIDDMLDYFSERPELTRRIATAEIAIGLWLVLW